MSAKPRGSITQYGYRRIRCKDRRLRFEHVLVWEEHFGPVPRGFEIHHVNEDKLDNRIENLRIVSRLEHKRIHGGCIFVDGVWWKPCGRCGVRKPVTDYYKKRDGIHSICRTCTIRLATMYKRLRRQRKAEVSAVEAPNELRRTQTSGGQSMTESVAQ